MTHRTKQQRNADNIASDTRAAKDKRRRKWLANHPNVKDRMQPKVPNELFAASYHVDCETDEMGHVFFVQCPELTRQILRDYLTHGLTDAERTEFNEVFSDDEDDANYFNLYEVVPNYYLPCLLLNGRDQYMGTASKVYLSYAEASEVADALLEEERQGQIGGATEDDPFDEDAFECDWEVDVDMIDIVNGFTGKA